MAFHILGTRVPSSLFNAYDLAAPTQTIIYGPSQFGWKFSTVGLAMFSKAFLKTRSPSWNVRYFILLLYRFSSHCWYDTICIAAALQSSFAISRSLVTTLALASLGIPVRSVGIPDFCGDYSFHPISKGKWRYPSWFPSSGPVDP